MLQVGTVSEIEYAAAFSSLALGALYLGLSCFAALGLGFATLAVPLALESGWTAAVWAVEGAAAFWLGRRQERWLARAAGLALQVLAGYAFYISQGPVFAFGPFINPAFTGGMLLDLSAGAIALWTREPAAPAMRASNAVGAPLNRPGSLFIGVGVPMLVVGYFAPLPPVSRSGPGVLLKPAVA